MKPDEMSLSVQSMTSASEVGLIPTPILEIRVPLDQEVCFDCLDMVLTIMDEESSTF